jgi:hypothetical protein
MANDRANARKLLTAAEFKLFEASRRDAICKLDAKTLKLKVELTRKRRDKYRDLYKRQRLAIRDQTGTKRGKSGAANARTKEKAALFEELRARFQARLAQVTAPPPRAARKKSPRKRVKAAVAAPGPRKTVSPKAPAAGRSAALSAIGAPGFMNERAEVAATLGRAHRSRSTVINAHLRSQGRRNQAKRDRR